MNDKQFTEANNIKAEIEKLSLFCGYIDEAMSSLPEENKTVGIDVLINSVGLTISTDNELMQRILESMYSTIDKKIVELQKKFSEL